MCSLVCAPTLRSELVEFPVKYEAYIDIMTSIYKALIDPYDAQDAKECAEEDWAEDVGDKDAPGLSQRKYMDGIFQLAVHTCARSPKEHQRTTLQACSDHRLVPPAALRLPPSACRLPPAARPLSWPSLA